MQAIRFKELLQGRLWFPAPGDLPSFAAGRACKTEANRSMVPNREAVRLCGRFTDDPLVTRRARRKVVIGGLRRR